MSRRRMLMIALLLGVGYFLYQLLDKRLRIHWGHHFSFQNELGTGIDSLEITIGNKMTHIKANPEKILEGNVEVPDTGYPHQVKITAYSGRDTIIMKADSFNCYHCDGSHHYILKITGAEYHFLN